MRMIARSATKVVVHTTMPRSATMQAPHLAAARRDVRFGRSTLSRGLRRLPAFASPRSAYPTPNRTSQSARGYVEAPCRLVQCRMDDIDTALAPYAALTPDCVLDALHSVGVEGDGRLLALNSYENRVYRSNVIDGSMVVAKFYRPTRWSDEAILEEH